MLTLSVRLRRRSVGGAIEGLPAADIARLRCVKMVVAHLPGERQEERLEADRDHPFTDRRDQVVDVELNCASFGESTPSRGDPYAVV